MAVTRINNNQISDASAGNVYVGVNAAAKLQDYSITAGKIANSLVYGSDLTVSGNLTVNGATTTIDTFNVVIEDPLLLLAKDQTGAPSLDIGYIGERGDETNIAFVWDESNTEFVTAYTSSTTTNTTISISSFADLRTYDLAVTGNLAVTGTSDFTGDVTAGIISASGNITGANLIANSGVFSSTLETTGNALIGGNLVVQGNITYINIDDLRVEDPIIILGTGPNGAPLTVDDGKDRGIYMEYYTSGLGNAFVGWQNSTGNLIAGSDVSFSANDVVQVNAYGTFQAGNVYAESGLIDGNLLVQSTANVNEFNAYGETANIAGNLNIGTTTSITNVALNVNATNSMKIPVGNSLQRPGTPVTGMIRFNTTTDSLEFYDSDGWTAAGTTFTIVVSDQFNGDGSTTDFTLVQDATTASVIVAINGVVQIPTIAYAVTGNLLSFTEAPEVSDYIDARILTTTTVVTAIQNATGNAVLEASSTSSAFNVTGDLIPTSNTTFNLGSSSSFWNDLYLAGSSIYLGNVILKENAGNLRVRNFDDTADAVVEATFTSTSTTSGNLQIGLNHIEATNANGNVELRPNGSGVILANSVIQLNAGIINGAGNGVGNIGNSSGQFNTIFAKATSAQYADLAEMYEADQPIDSGTVVCFGGIKEVTICTEESSNRVAGVVSTNPSYLMNSGCPGEHVVPVALTGRVPCKVVGPVAKGDMMVSAGDGRARASADPKIGSVIGKALENFDGNEGVIEVVVGRI